MSAFGGMVLTNRGRNLQAKAQAGAQLNFTRFGVGDGEIGGSSIIELNALKNQVKSVNITKAKAVTGGKATIGMVLSNQDLATGFYFREIGLFAQDPDVGEILYCYANAGATADYIPAGGGTDVVEKSFDVIAIVGTASNVTATIDSSLIYASAQDLLDHENNGSVHVTSDEKSTWNGKANGADLEALHDDVETHKADVANKTDDTKGATLIGIKPIDGLTGDNVRTVIQNLFLGASDVKTKVATAITGKGIPASSSDTGQQLADKIGQVGADYAKYKAFNVVSAYPRKITSEGIWCSFGMTNGCKLYDANGTLLFTHSQAVRFFDYISDNEMLFANSSAILIYSRTGTQIKYLAVGYAPCFIVGNSTKYYVAENGTTNLKVYDKNFTLLKTITMPFTLTFSMRGKADDKSIIIQNDYSTYIYIDLTTDTVTTGYVSPVLL